MGSSMCLLIVIDERPDFFKIRRNDVRMLSAIPTYDEMPRVSRALEIISCTISEDGLR